MTKRARNECPRQNNVELHHDVHVVDTTNKYFLAAAATNNTQYTIQEEGNL